MSKLIWLSALVFVMGASVSGANAQNAASPIDRIDCPTKATQEPMISTCEIGEKVDKKLEIMKGIEIKPNGIIGGPNSFIRKPFGIKF